MSALHKAIILILVVCVCNLVTGAFADQAPIIAELYSKQGAVQVRLSGTDKWEEAAAGAALHVDDTIRVGAEGLAGISFRAGSYIRLSNNSLLRIEVPPGGAGDVPSLNMGIGKAYFFSREPRELPSIITPLVSAAIRGTEFGIEVAQNETRITVIDGEVEASNQYGSARVQKGEQAITEPGKAPLVRIVVNPAESVQWALRYPNVVELEGAGVRTCPRDLLMSVGTRAQQSIIALVQDRKEEALSIAQEAHAQCPESISATLALSYAYQARFDLESAREILERFSEHTLSHFAVLARLAELHLSFGEVEEAEQRLKEALKLNTQDAYTQALQGFVLLFKDDPETARGYFVSAIQLDGAYGLPHLGLGLVHMRTSDTEKAMQEFKRAVHLEPNVALYRSYLGKAFFEDEREDLSLHEYGLAIERDRDDPTPWLYRAFSNLSQNRVVDALRDVEESIARNDKRAVYRSRLLLDQDRGVRSAGLARVFTSLGFDEVARIEAIKSINADYSNYSAHRLLADASTSLFLADAGFSERRIADLLAPLSFNLFQSSGETASLNEYSALFDKNEERFGAEAVFDGRDDIYSGNAFQAGREDDFGYAVGLQSGFADGTRHNNYLRDYRFSLAGQYQATWQDRVTLEGTGQFREFKDEGGSPQEAEFHTGTLRAGYHRRLAPGSTLIGQLAFRRGDLDTRDSIVDDASINFITAQEQGEIPDDLLLRDNTDEEVSSMRSGAQYLLSSKWLSALGGFQFYLQEADRDQNGEIIDDADGFFSGLDRRVRSHGDNTISSEDVYGYSTVHVTPWADLHAGVTHSTVEIEEREITPFVQGSIVQSRLNPKLGLTLYPLGDLTIRGAYFETLRKSALEDQDSLEPTIVGGLNQRFTDLSGTESRNLGVGVDYKIPGMTYIGAEWTKRHLIEKGADAQIDFDFDFIDQSQSQGASVGERFEQHLEQDVVRAYWYQVLWDRLVATCTYQFTQQNNNDPEIFQELENHKIVFGTRYFDPSGVFVFGTATWREQQRSNGFFLQDGIDDFWVIDAGLGYRIPKRHGTLTLEFLNLGNQDFEYDQSLGFEPFIKDEFAARLVLAVNF